MLGELAPAPAVEDEPMATNLIGECSDSFCATCTRGKSSLEWSMEAVHAASRSRPGSFASASVRHSARVALKGENAISDATVHCTINDTCVRPVLNIAAALPLPNE